MSETDADTAHLENWPAREAEAERDSLRAQLQRMRAMLAAAASAMRMSNASTDWSPFVADIESALADSPAQSGEKCPDCGTESQFHADLCPAGATPEPTERREG